MSSLITTSSVRVIHYFQEANKDTQSPHKAIFVTIKPFCCLYIFTSVNDCKVAFDLFILTGSVELLISYN